MGTLRLTVESSPEGEWIGFWTDEGALLDTPVLIGPEQVRELANVRRSYEEILANDSESPPHWDQLDHLGRVMTDLWFGPVADRFVPAPTAEAGTKSSGKPEEPTSGSGPTSEVFDSTFSIERDQPETSSTPFEPNLLFVVTNDRYIHNLPWELASPGGGGLLGQDPRWVIIRAIYPSDLGQTTAAGTLGRAVPPPIPGPLRVLSISTAPLDRSATSIEEEERAFLKLLNQIPPTTEVLFAESGTFDELDELVDQFEPHIVHFSGMASVDRAGRGLLAFEDDLGQIQYRSVEDLVATILRGSSVRCLVFNLVDRSRIAGAAVGMSLQEAGGPPCLVFDRPLRDDVSLEFLVHWYGSLAQGRTMAAALISTRSGQTGQFRARRPNLSFAHASLHSKADIHVIHPDRAQECPTRSIVSRRVLAWGLIELRRGMVGARRLIQQILGTLRLGHPPLLILTGAEGTGKTTLALRLSERLRVEDFRPIVIRCPGPVEWSPARRARLTWTILMEKLAEAFKEADRHDLHAILRNGKLPARYLTFSALDGLSGTRAIVVIDDLEQALEPETGRVADPELLEFLQAFGRLHSAGSRVILVSRTEPEPSLLGARLAMPEFSTHDLIKLLRSDSRVESRWTSEPEFARELLELVHRAPAHAGLWELLRVALRAHDPSEFVSRDLDELGEQVTRGLLDQLTPSARRLAAKIAVSELPWPENLVDQLEAESGIDEAAIIAEIVDSGLVQRASSLQGTPFLRISDWNRARVMRSLEEPDEFADRAKRNHAQFWQACLRGNQTDDLGIDHFGALLQCHLLAQSAHDGPTWSWSARLLAERFRTRSELTEAFTWIQEVPERDRDPMSWLALGQIAMELDRLGDARSAVDKLLESQDAPALPGVLLLKANLAVREHRDTDAIADLDRALVLMRQCEDGLGETQVLTQLGQIALNQGEHAEARERFQAALRSRQAAGDRSGEAGCWFNLAISHLREGRPREARGELFKALRIHQSLKDGAGEASIWHNLATLDLREGLTRDARRAWMEALRLNQSLGDRGGEATAWHNLAAIDLREGQINEARRKCGLSLRINQAIADRAGEAAAWHELGLIDLETGDFHAAKEKLRSSLQIKQSIGDRVGESATWHNLASLDLDSGDFDGAREKFENSLRIKQSIGHRAGEASTWHGLATLDIKEGHYLDAVTKMIRALRIKQQLGHRAAEPGTWRQFATVAERLERPEHALKLHALRCAVEGAFHEPDTDMFEQLGEKLGLDQDDRQTLLADATEAYQSDGGLSWILEAFPEARHEPLEDVEAGD